MLDLVINQRRRSLGRFESDVVSGAESTVRRCDELAPPSGWRPILAAGAHLHPVGRIEKPQKFRVLLEWRAKHDKKQNLGTWEVVERLQAGTQGPRQSESPV